jgi:hypothetical protein
VDLDAGCGVVSAYYRRGGGTEAETGRGEGEGALARVPPGLGFLPQSSDR